MNSSHQNILAKLKATTQYLLKHTSYPIDLAVVLGSGLGSLADEVEDAKVISYSEIPHFHGTQVAGHEGRLIFGKVGGARVAFLQGRFHFYEGYPIDEVVLPARVMGLLGARVLLQTNAAGGVNTRYRPADLMVIDDHINLTGSNPLFGKNLDKLGPRFPDMTEAYDPGAKAIIKQTALEKGIAIHAGVYGGLLGPTYETPAEIRMFRTLGIDAVGMSTVPETIAAHHLGLKVAGISCITNLAAGLSTEKLTHDEVIENSKEGALKLKRLLRAAIPRLAEIPPGRNREIKLEDLDP